MLFRSGRVPDGELETRGRIDTGGRVVLDELEGRIIASSSDGVCIFDREGALVGIDGFAQPVAVMPAAIAEDALAVLQIERGRFGLGGSRYLMHLMEPATARVLETTDVRLFGEPSSVLAMDDRLLITAGEATLVLRDPAE